MTSLGVAMDGQTAIFTRVKMTDRCVPIVPIFASRYVGDALLDAITLFESAGESGFQSRKSHPISLA